MIRKFRKKPIVIEAIEWDGQLSTMAELKVWGATVQAGTVDGDRALLIGTLEDGPNFEAKHYASLGDFIVREVRHEFYPVKPEIMTATYDEVPQ